LARSVSFLEARWSKRPPIPLAVLSGLLGGGAFVLVLVGLRAVLGAETSRWADQAGSRVGLMVLGLSLVGAAFALVRGWFKRGTPVALREDSLAYAQRVIPYGEIVEVSFGNREATHSLSAGQTEKTTDAELIIKAGSFRLALIAPDCHVNDFDQALEPITRGNPQANVFERL
jgi:hypothetical protein